VSKHRLSFAIDLDTKFFTCRFGLYGVKVTYGNKIRTLSMKIRPSMKMILGIEPALSQPFLISVEGSLFDAKLADHTDLVERVTVKSLLEPYASLFKTHDSDSCLA
jgi:hypothetical protein